MRKRTKKKFERVLPIEQAETEIKKSIMSFSITIVPTPTGSGKTLFIPKYIHDLFGTKVFCTVPRVPIAKRSAKSANTVVWGRNACGYITGRGSDCPKDSTVVYATEGSVLNMISNGFMPKVMMIDEAHEQGVLVEALLRKAKDIVLAGGKVVIASATIDSHKYLSYYERNGISANIVYLPQVESPFKIEFMNLLGESPAKMIADMANKGYRCLVGVSGKKEIDEFIYSLSQHKCKAPIFPFHSELEEEEQEAIDKCDGAMVIVSTNILQSGVTLPQVSVGYFDGVGKAIFRQNGVNKLKPYLLSKAEMKQWYGRLGRTCDGIVFVESEQERMEMPVPEIKRVALEEAALTLAGVGIDIFNADLLNQPEEEALIEAVGNLHTLRLLDLDNTITDLGKKVLFAGNGIRSGIISVLGVERGFANTAAKIAAIIAIGSPFRKTRFQKEWYNGDSKQSDLLLWRDVVDYFSKEYTYDGKVELHRVDAFKEICERNNIFRRGLKKLIRIFSQIDALYSDTNTNQQDVVEIIFEAFNDSVEDPYSPVRDAMDSIAIGEGMRCGNILSIGNSIFFEHVTYKTKYESL